MWKVSRLHLQHPLFPVCPETAKGQLQNENAQAAVNQMTAEALRI